MKKSQWFAVFGFIFGWGAPLGALGLRFLAQRPFPDPFSFVRQDWAQNTFFYWYMLVGTCAVFTLIGYVIGKYEEQAEQETWHKVDEAIHDSLTGLASHRRMHEIFAAQFKRHLDNEQPISCLMIDLDRFSEINDAYGHSFGDTVLKDFAQLFRNNIRQADIVARYGGEEFLCIMPDCDERDAKDVAERIRTETEKLVFPLGKAPVKITVSVGAVTVHDMRQIDYHFMIAEASKNLFKAKTQGRNRTVQNVFFDKATVGR